MTDTKEENYYKVVEYFYTVIGSLLTAAAVVFFATPARIANGGVSGIAIILHHTLGFDVGTTILVLSIPLFFVGIRIFGREYGLKSLLGTLLFSFFTMILTKFFGDGGVIDYSHYVSYLLSAIFAGILFGAGLGFVLKSGANTGGTDIIAQIIAKFTPLSLGTSLFVTDAAIVICSIFFFGIESAMYAVITIYITSVGIDRVLLGASSYNSKTLYIITDKQEEIRKVILEELDHSGTIFQAKGMYTGEDRPVLMTVIKKNKIGRLINEIKNHDKEAFVIVQDTYQVMGEGFTSISKAAWSSKHL
jgi:uncharacterized membrane-anchored protein YitT (DUF2179 family)